MLFTPLRGALRLGSSVLATSMGRLEAPALALNSGTLDLLMSSQSVTRSGDERQAGKSTDTLQAKSDESRELVL